MVVCGLVTFDVGQVFNVIEELMKFSFRDDIF